LTKFRLHSSGDAGGIPQNPGQVFFKKAVAVDVRKVSNATETSREQDSKNRDKFVRKNIERLKEFCMSMDWYIYYTTQAQDLDEVLKIFVLKSFSLGFKMRGLSIRKRTMTPQKVEESAEINRMKFANGDKLQTDTFTSQIYNRTPRSNSQYDYLDYRNNNNPNLLGNPIIVIYKVGSTRTRCSSFSLNLNAKEVSTSHNVLINGSMCQSINGHDGCSNTGSPDKLDISPPKSGFSMNKNRRSSIFSITETEQKMKKSNYHNNKIMADLDLFLDDSTP
jgi:hypothetical protein